MPSGKKEKDIRWLTTNEKKEQELIVTKRKSSVQLLFLFITFIEINRFIIAKM